MNAQSLPLLLVDDDPLFASVAARGLARRGFDVRVAHSCDEARTRFAPEIGHVLLDLSLGAESGLALVPHLKAVNPSVRVLILTGYASIATAVDAIKLGAEDYLTKPTDLDSVVHALLGKPAGTPVTAANSGGQPDPLSVERLEWEHIQRVLHDNEGNISATARALKMHRRTLQRKLSKRPAKA